MEPAAEEAVGGHHRYPDVDRSPSEYSPCASPTSPWAPSGPPVPTDMWPSPRAPDTGGHMGLPQQQSRRRSSTMHQFDPPGQRAPPPPQHYDQFDEFVYQSQHMAGGGRQQVSPHHLQQVQPPPEVNIEVPSDSDSSRRPSKVSNFSGMGGPNSMSSGTLPYDDSDDPVSPARSAQNQVAGQSVDAVSKGAGDRRSSNSRRGSMAVGHVTVAQQGTGGNRRTSICATVASNHAGLLAARPVLDRRSSHTGVLLPRSAGPSRGHSPGQGSPRGAGGHMGQTPSSSNMLGVPRRRSRGASLPGSMNAELNQEDIYRLRNFSMAGRKVVNRGDSLKARSTHSINSTGSSVELRNASNYSSSLTNSGEDFSACSANSSRRPSRASRRSSHVGGAQAAAAAVAALSNGLEDLEVERATGPPPARHRVAMLGASGVGKSALTSQFLSSDHRDTYDAVEDDVQKVVSINVDGNESQITFVDHAHTDMSVENLMSTYGPDGFIVVFAVDEEETLEQAERILLYLREAGVTDNAAVILVANKTDLVRSRVVSSGAGKAVAIKYGVKYIETSPGINHNVDELLVGVVTQIKLRREEERKRGQMQGSRTKVLGNRVFNLLERVMNIQNNKTKSCGNLHVL